jgi:hypothetical protein
LRATAKCNKIVNPATTQILSSQVSNLSYDGDVPEAMLKRTLSCRRTRSYPAQRIFPQFIVTFHPRGLDPIRLGLLKLAGKNKQPILFLESGGHMARRDLADFTALPQLGKKRKHQSLIRIGKHFQLSNQLLNRFFTHDQKITGLRYAFKECPI